VGIFDNIDREPPMKAVRKHTDNKRVIPCIERALTVPIKMSDGTMKKRKAGVPQGGVKGPVSVNLFMYCAFDLRMSGENPQNP
jgi:retron-type reverse transcriptase